MAPRAVWLALVTVAVCAAIASAAETDALRNERLIRESLAQEKQEYDNRRSKEKHASIGRRQASNAKNPTKKGARAAKRKGATTTPKRKKSKASKPKGRGKKARKRSARRDL